MDNDERVKLSTLANGDVVVRDAKDMGLLGVVTKMSNSPTRYKVIGEDTYGWTIEELASGLADRAAGKPRRARGKR